MSIGYVKAKIAVLCPRMTESDALDWACASASAVNECHKAVIQYELASRFVAVSAFHFSSMKVIQGQ